MALDEENSRKPKLWLWMKNSLGNPNCGSEETVVAVYLHRFISLFLLFVLLLKEILNYFVLLLVRDLNILKYQPPLGGSFLL